MLEGKLGETLSQSATDKICKIASEVPATKATSDTGTNPEPKKRDGSIFVFKLKKYYHRHQRLSSRGLLATLTPTVPATCQQRNRKSVVSLAEKTLYHSHWDREATFFFMIVRTTVKFRGHGGRIFFSLISPEWGHPLAVKHDIIKKFGRKLSFLVRFRSFAVSFAVGHSSSQNANFTLSNTFFFYNKQSVRTSTCKYFVKRTQWKKPQKHA